MSGGSSFPFPSSISIQAALTPGPQEAPTIAQGTLTATLRTETKSPEALAPVPDSWCAIRRDDSEDGLITAPSQRILLSHGPISDKLSSPLGRLSSQD